MKIFYVCSYGGCGSKILCNALSTYGKAQHIHSRVPPEKLEYVGRNKGGKCYQEWFNGIKIPEEKIGDYYIIYIYKNPIDAILSRFDTPKHLEHIQIDSSIKLDDVIKHSTDLYKIKEFYNNYTQNNEKRNYKIYCVRYEDIFEKHNELSQMLGIGNLKLTKKETNRTEIKNKYFGELSKIYKDLIDTMNNNKFVFIS